MFQAESVRDAAFGCDWVGTPIPFQRCLMFIIAIANKEFHLTAGKFVPVTNVTTLNVCRIPYYKPHCKPCSHIRYTETLLSI
jgi:7tm Odorant receptor.